MAGNGLGKIFYRIRMGPEPGLQLTKTWKRTELGFDKDLQYNRQLVLEYNGTGIRVKPKKYLEENWAGQWSATYQAVIYITTRLPLLHTLQSTRFTEHSWLRHWFMTSIMTISTHVSPPPQVLNKSQLKSIISKYCVIFLLFSFLNQ